MLTGVETSTADGKAPLEAGVGLQAEENGAVQGLIAEYVWTYIYVK